MNEKEPKKSGKQYKNAVSFKNGNRRVTVSKGKEFSFNVEFSFVRPKPEAEHVIVRYEHGCLFTQLVLSPEAAEMLMFGLANQLGFESIK